jgi:cytochrome c-type biogenesis protein CcmH/NrfG
MIGTAEGLLQDQEHNTTRALSIYSEEVKRNPSNALSQLLLAEALSNEKHEGDKSVDQRAIEVANRAVKLDPTFVAAHDLLARLYLRAGKTSLAIQHSRVALEVDASDKAAIYNLIQALREAHRTKEIPALAKRLGELEAGSLRGRKDFRLEESSRVSPLGGPN